MPGDKSIGHRALMLASIARGRSSIRELPNGLDVSSTAACLRGLGIEIDSDGDTVQVHSRGELQAPAGDLDAGNSGTTMRLLSGILAGQAFRSRLVGDASLSRRPMGRVVEPLTRMGAHIESDGGRAPLDIQGGRLHGIDYALPVASAQVKSAVLLAGLFAEDVTRVTEPAPTRDHTERMLGALGVHVERENGSLAVSGGARPRPFDLVVPGDQSSAAFLLAAAALTDGQVRVRDVGVNPTRTGFLHVLKRMGVSIDVLDQREELGEPVATVTASGRVNLPITVEPDDVPLLVDELPLVALLATQASGTTTVRGAQELRVKESDRIASVVRSLSAMGADVRELPDGFVVHGPTRLKGTTVGSDGDHRLAMMLAVAGTTAVGETVIEGVESAAVSYPSFEETFLRLGGVIRAS